MVTKGPELVIGLVAPLGTSTTELATEVKGALAAYGYKPVIIKMSDLIPGSGPLGEAEDDRIRRLIAAGNAFCKANDDDPAALARLAINRIRASRIDLLRQTGDTRPTEDLVIGGRPRTAYIIQSLKRLDEVQLLREVYGSQFILLGSQGTLEQRTASLMRLSLSSLPESSRRDLVKLLIQVDAKDDDPLGQNVNATYPQADFFIRNNARSEIDRVIGLLFGASIAPEIGEFAMYVARASRARSLAASRKVGAAIVVGDAVVATGYNDVPHGQESDILEGVDTSEQFKRDNLSDTLRRLKSAGMLNDAVTIDEAAVSAAAAALKGGDLLSVIEYQRAVHAEARAIDDATIRGVSTVDGVLYVTTFPCHLCYKHALSARIKRVEYIDPYPKSRAVQMYPVDVEERLIPFTGVAPRRYLEIFDDRPAPQSDESGRFPTHDPSVAQPLVGPVSEDDSRADKERRAIHRLKEQYRT